MSSDSMVAVSAHLLLRELLQVPTVNAREELTTAPSNPSSLSSRFSSSSSLFLRCPYQLARLPLRCSSKSRQLRPISVRTTGKLSPAC